MFEHLQIHPQVFEKFNLKFHKEKRFWDAPVLLFARKLVNKQRGFFSSPFSGDSPSEQV